MFFDLVKAVQVNPHRLQVLPRWRRSVQSGQEGLGQTLWREMVGVEHPDQPSFLKERRPSELFQVGSDSRNDERPPSEGQNLSHRVIPAPGHDQVRGGHEVQ